MKTTIPFFTLLVLFLCTSAKPPRGVEPHPRLSMGLTKKVFDPIKEGYQLILEDNFDGTTLDTALWKPRAVGPRACGYVSEKAIKVSDGTLKLYYDIVGDSAISGAIGTQGRFDTRYGYYECRARVMNTYGAWSAFWIQSGKIAAGEDPAQYGTEIDIFEYFKQHGPDVMTHCLHWAYGPNQKSTGQLRSYVKNVAKGYHTFAVEWTPEKYAFFVDGIKYHEITQAVSHIDQYMIFSIELPGKLEGLKKTIAPDSLVVDYVRVYQKP